MWPWKIKMIHLPVLLALFCCVFRIETPPVCSTHYKYSEQSDLRFMKETHNTSGKRHFNELFSDPTCLYNTKYLDGLKAASLKRVLTLAVQFNSVFQTWRTYPLIIQSCYDMTLYWKISTLDTIHSPTCIHNLSLLIQIYP